MKIRTGSKIPEPEIVTCRICSKPTTFLLMWDNAASKQVEVPCLACVKEAYEVRQIDL